MVKKIITILIGVIFSIQLLAQNGYTNLRQSYQLPKFANIGVDTLFFTSASYIKDDSLTINGDRFPFTNITIDTITYADTSIYSLVSDTTLNEADPIWVADSALFARKDTLASYLLAAQIRSEISDSIAAHPETDPIFTASFIAGITQADTTNWHLAYSWGDHSIVGYLVGADTVYLSTIVTNLLDSVQAKSDTDHVHTIDEVTGLQDSLTNKSNIGHTHSISDVTDLQDSLDLFLVGGDTVSLSNRIDAIPTVDTTNLSYRCDTMQDAFYYKYQTDSISTEINNLFPSFNTVVLRRFSGAKDTLFTGYYATCDAIDNAVAGDHIIIYKGYYIDTLSGTTTNSHYKEGVTYECHGYPLIERDQSTGYFYNAGNAAGNDSTVFFKGTARFTLTNGDGIFYINNSTVGYKIDLEIYSATLSAGYFCNIVGDAIADIKFHNISSAGNHVFYFHANGNGTNMNIDGNRVYNSTANTCFHIAGTAGQSPKYNISVNYVQSLSGFGFDLQNGKPYVNVRGNYIDDIDTDPGANGFISLIVDCDYIEYLDNDRGANINHRGYINEFVGGATLGSLVSEIHLDRVGTISDMSHALTDVETQYYYINSVQSMRFYAAGYHYGKYDIGYCGLLSFDLNSSETVTDNYFKIDLLDSIYIPAADLARVYNNTFDIGVGNFTDAQLVLEGGKTDSANVFNIKLNTVRYDFNPKIVINNGAIVNINEDILIHPNSTPTSAYPFISMTGGTLNINAEIRQINANTYNDSVILYMTGGRLNLGSNGKLVNINAKSCIHIAGDCTFQHDGGVLVTDGIYSINNPASTVTVKNYNNYYTNVARTGTFNSDITGGGIEIVDTEVD